MDHLAQLIVLTLAAGTPLVYAALGELVTEKSGVLNLGVEGMMLAGAVTSFIVAATTHSAWLGVAAGMTAGAALSLIFGVLTLSLMARFASQGKDDYAGRVLAMMRKSFGGHAVQSAPGDSGGGA